MSGGVHGPLDMQPISLNGSRHAHKLAVTRDALAPYNVEAYIAAQSVLDLSVDLLKSMGGPRSCS